jgi:hypothetical protein
MNQALYAHMNNKRKMKKKSQEKMLTIPGHNENANQTHTKIPPHSC